MTLPTYMLAITPQKISGCSRINRGPGCTPWMRKALSSTAITTLGAMPRVSSGIIEPPVAALFAASGAATPSIIPVPKRSGCFESRRSSAYEMKVGMIAPIPGRMPRKKPSTLPRAIGAADRFQSSRVGSRPLMRVSKTSCSTPFSMLCSTSLTPNRPMMIGTRPSPSARVRVP